MGWLKKLSNLFAPAPKRAERGYMVYVRCGRCGETLNTRVDLYNDLSIDYGDGESKTTYFTHKTLIGSKLCFNPVEVRLTFDEHKKLIDRKISGGEFLAEPDSQG
jgi:hypothetical protein